MLAFWNVDLRCEYANQEYIKCFSRHGDQIIGIHLEEFLGKELFNKNEPLIKKVLSGENQKFERNLISIAGKELFGIIEYICFREDNQIKGFIVLATDVSELKKLELNLLKKTHLLNTINLMNGILVNSNTVEDAVVNICKTLVEKGKFSMSWFGVVNEATKIIEIQTSHGDQFGYLDSIKIAVDTPPEKDGPVSIALRTKETIVVQDALNDPRLAQWSIQRSKTNWSSSIALPIITDSTRAILVVYVNEKDYFEEDVVQMLTAVVSNFKMFISRKETEQQLLLSAKLASLGEMSAGVAHEINNPLMIISGSVKLLTRHSHSPEKLNSISESIQKSCDRINKIVQGLKNFSRNTVGTEYKIQSLNKIIDEVLILTMAKTKLNEVNISTELTTHATILCNEIEIEQVLINLINNAVDAIKDNEIKWIKIDLLDSTEKIIFRITDSGTGISETLQNKIFDPFFTTKPVGEGTGLGLSVSKGILEKHNASFNLLTMNKNTCFEIVFPKA
jgi:signal transduction histidine kinase